MDNPKKPATRDTGRRQTKQKTQHNTEDQKDEQHRPRQKLGVNPGDPASHKTPTMSLI